MAEAMAYVGIQSQIHKNNRNSLLLLILFPALLLGMVYAILFFSGGNTMETSNAAFIQVIPFVLVGVSIWFAIAYFSHSAIISQTTGARTLQRKDNKRVYNLVENLCISQGMPLPKIRVIEDDSLNAYASGINNKTYTVTLSRGIIDKLDDSELEGVIAHELAHIRNRDTRLLIITIVFVGIFALLSQVAFRTFLYRGGRRSGKDNNGGISLVVVVVVVAVAYLISMLLKFGISRKREYMADAGAAEMTRNPLALASALRKISADPYIEAIKNEDVAQLFIDHPAPPEKKKSFSLNSLFATHPPIEKRIRILEDF